MERERLEVDVLFVGAGPASLAAAYHLSRLLGEHNQEAGNPLEDLTMLVIEKGKQLGSHALSGAVIDPRAFDELLGADAPEQPPYDSPVREDALYILSSSGSYRSPITPPPLNNHGYYVGSLGKLVPWMAGLCEARGIEVYPEFPAVELLFEGGQVIGARIGDKGRARDGSAKPNFEHGIDVVAKVTVLGEGPRGTLAGQAFKRLDLGKDRHPQIYSVGVKEIWQVKDQLEPGVTYHTLGYPLGTEEFGGGFIYSLSGNQVAVGFVVGLDYRNPCTDAHLLFQKFKQHPLVKEILEGGRILSYGAKAIPEGGYYSMPRLYADGLLMVGDTAGFLNAQRLKGIHLAIKSGMLAAESILEAFQKNDFTSGTLKGYADRFEKSWAKDELWQVRNFRQAYQRGFWRGMLHSAAQFLSRGRGISDPVPTQAGHTRMKMLNEYFGKNEADCPSMKFDGKRTFDKLTDVYYSNTAHEEEQPCHLKILDFDICHNRCTYEYGNPCQHFCPAHVYEMVETDRGKRLQLNFTNCVHCKTCDIMDPYQIILWTPPEGGGGPDYKNM
jgi:electron-transferring-flavoprotein dehydrogenase